MTASIHLAAADYLVIVGYCIVVLWIGLWFRKRLVTVTDYFAGGHQIPWWLAGISHYMSSFSAFSFIAYTQIAYLYGFTAITLFWASVPACIAGGLLFAKRWRRARVVTPVEFLEQRYSRTVQQLCAWGGVPVKIFDDALKVFATGLFLSVVCGFSLSWSIVACGGIMVAYSFFGGLWSLVVTDYVQFLMKSLAILLLVPLAIHASGGLGKGFRGLPRGFLMPVNGPYTWVYVIGFACVMMLSYNASWSLAQKYYSVSDEQAASKAAYLSAGLNLIGAPLMILPGLLARHFLPDLAATGRSADTYVLLLVKLLPAGMVGITMAAMLSATMASVSSDFNAIASVMTQDVYHRFVNPKASPAKLFQTGRMFTIVLGALTTMLSLVIVYSHREALFNVMVTVFGIFMAPTLLPILVGLLSKRATASGALTGFVSGLTSGFVMLVLKNFSRFGNESARSSYEFEGVALLLNIGMTILGMILGSVVGRRSASERQRALEFAERMAEPVSGDAQEAGGASGMETILPMATACVALLIAVAGVISHSRLALWIDSAVAAFFLLISYFLFVTARTRERREMTAVSGAE